MQDEKTLVEYATQLLRQGVSLTEVERSLYNHTQNTELVNRVIAQVANSRNEKSSQRKKLWLIAGLGLLLLVAIFTVYILASGDNTTEETSYRHTETLSFTDPNVTMQVPSVWSVSANYKPGISPIIFESPKLIDKPNNPSVRMFIVTDPRGLVNSIEDTVANGEYEIMTDESFERNSYDYRYVELKQHDQSEEALSYTAIVNLSKDDDVYSGSVNMSPELWDVFQESIKTSLTSIVITRD